jgi:hypothetical protein
LPIVGQDEVREGQHAIGALAGILDHDVAAIVDVIGIAAEAAAHDVGPRPPVEYVEDETAVQDIVVRATVDEGGAW